MIGCPDGGIGRRAGLKHLWSQGRAGSTPALGTIDRLQISTGSATLNRKLQTQFSSIFPDS